VCCFTVEDLWNCNTYIVTFHTEKEVYTLVMLLFTVVHHKIEPVDDLWKT
jgi:hypothetical protein